ncbi:GAF domain-containing protein [Flavihumibacter solisilvae]|uniref:GAF domain-containing protein n=1 Tax=Flavihumibacter solisilvae TaxID=1349421 RepID=A0A0C1L0J6_9BACT|nr:GAF domain-containing protein [Flavihumibacter solisilvae]KIC93502.1 hypothetical protein OI18_17245 [Flavihumibacter solisilvae]
MQTGIVDMSERMQFQFDLDTMISFKPFIDYLGQCEMQEGSIKRELYQRALRAFSACKVYDQDIPLEAAAQYQELFEFVYACVTPTLESEKKLSWGLCLPLNPTFFYGTDKLYQFFSDALSNRYFSDMFDKKDEALREERMRTIYLLILEKLYHFKPFTKEQALNNTRDAQQLPSHFMARIDTRFISVRPKQQLPSLDLRRVQALLNEGGGYEIFERFVPMHQFAFRGIGIISIEDITSNQAINNIRNTITICVPGNEDEVYRIVSQSLKMLLQDKEIDFGMVPVMQLNGKPVLGSGQARMSLLATHWHRMQDYLNNPIPLIFTDIREEDVSKYRFLEPLKDDGICSLALIPITHNNILVGITEVFTHHPVKFTPSILPLIEPVLPILGQLYRFYLDQLEWEVVATIRNKFTSLLPAVQWKFNEAAWKYLLHKQGNDDADIEPIAFRNVYPLYGAIDVRNSTMERNMAIKADFHSQLSALDALLESLNTGHDTALLDEILFKCRHMLDATSGEMLTINDESRISNFLSTEVRPLLQHLKNEDETHVPAIDEFMALSDDMHDSTFANKYNFEQSMKLLNDAINKYIESENEKMQKAYPFYFEKFRTDGIEYNIYIGQEITPSKAFNRFHLKNLRIWQLNSMVSIVKMTRDLKAQLPHPLATTQLIFVHNHPIDISFRTDERKFDVEGAYNIRYEMVKKRIDKVHVLGNGERLTQPEKIAIIYFNRRDIDDYIGFIQYLQEKKLLCHEVEQLDLEELQGISGLKAIRVTVA